jgi:hypothetical protein
MSDGSFRYGPEIYISGEHAGKTLVDSDVYERMEAIIAAARLPNNLLLRIALKHFDDHGGALRRMGE